MSFQMGLSIFLSAVLCILGFTNAAFAQTRGSVDSGKCAADATVNFASFNIGFCRNTSDLNRWNARKDLIVGIVKDENFDICAFQEPYAFQVGYLGDMLPDYAFAGVLLGDEKAENFAARPDNFVKKEILLLNMNNPVFYKKSRFELLDSGKFWFSKTPDIPSGGWLENRFDSMRSCVWAKFSDRASGAKFYVFNVHLICQFSPHDKEALKAAQLLLDRIKSIAGSSQFIVCGDFNARENFDCIKLLKSSNVLKDTKDIAASVRLARPETFVDFDGKNSKAGIIDYIFTSPDMRVNTFKSIERPLNGVYPSDHLPVVSELVLK